MRGHDIHFGDKVRYVRTPLEAADLIEQYAIGNSAEEMRQLAMEMRGRYRNRITNEPPDGIATIGYVELPNDEETCDCGDVYCEDSTEYEPYCVANVMLTGTSPNYLGREAYPQECFEVVECGYGCPVGTTPLRNGVAVPGSGGETYQTKVGNQTITISTKATMPEVDNKGIQLAITRKDGKTLFKFEIAPEVEAIYQGTEIKESSKWPGLSFYTNEAMRKSEQYQSKLARLNLFDDYGQGFYRNGAMNIAWVRTVGGKGTIELTENIGFAELSVLVNNVVAFTKEFFEDYFREFTISGNLQVDMPPKEVVTS